MNLNETASEGFRVFFFVFFFRCQRSCAQVDRALLDLNVIGTISITKAALPHLLKSKGQVMTDPSAWNDVLN